jgi:glutamate synthase domain-containing protein 3
LLDHPKANTLDLSALLAAHNPAFGAPFRTWPRNVHTASSLTDRIIKEAAAAIEHKEPVHLRYPIANTDRTVGARLAGKIAERWGNDGLPPHTIRIDLEGSAGQSFGAFMIEGMTMHLRGEANDYTGKGMAGGELVIACPIPSLRKDVIVGNTVLYGATGGTFLAGGSAGERFAVRNSGATAVVEGVGDHGCEYMTAGRVVVLGSTGKNFGAGMTGGIAFVYDPRHRLPVRCHHDFVILETVSSTEDRASLREFVEAHAEATASLVSQAILEDWDEAVTHFWKVIPRASLIVPAGGEVSSEDFAEAGGE